MYRRRRRRSRRLRRRVAGIAAAARAAAGKANQHEDDLAVAGDEGRLVHVLFSSDPDDVGLYGKPMARNSQIWTEHYEMFLDAPRADRDELRRAARALREGIRFG